MKFALSSRSKATTPNSDASPPTSTVAPSIQKSSATQLEKEEPDIPIGTGSTSSNASKGQEKEKVVEETPLEEAAALDKVADEPDYPSGLKLGIIVASLCLSVFCMALVGLPDHHPSLEMLYADDEVG